MNNVKHIAYVSIAIMFLMGALAIATRFMDVITQRNDYVTKEMNQKPTVQLNVPLAGGNNSISRQSVLTNILSMDESIAVYIDGTQVDYASVYQVIYRGVSATKIFPSNTLYTVNYETDANGKITSIYYETVN